MTDFLNKIIATILAFMILFVGPAAVLTLSMQLTMERSVMNEMSSFVDKVTDNGTITDTELADFYLGAASNGAVMDIKIYRYMTVAVPDGTGGTDTVYQLVDNIMSYNKGDYIQVRVKAIDYTGAQRLLYRIANIFMGKFDETMSGRVRN